MNQKLSLNEIGQLLLAGSYTAKDIKQLTGYSKNWVTKVMNDCRAMHRGAIAGRPNAITAESFWKWNGTTIDEQIRLYRLATKE